MGYTTSFKGKFTLNKRLDPVMHQYLLHFAATRHMVRKGLPEHFGVDGEFYANESDQARWCWPEFETPNCNKPPISQPGLWCQWTPTADGLGIEWNGAEKFYEYVEWLQYLINNFLAPYGYVLNGAVSWSGEDDEDNGVIEVIENIICTTETEPQNVLDACKSIKELINSGLEESELDKAIKVLLDKYKNEDE